MEKADEPEVDDSEDPDAERVAVPMVEEEANEGVWECMEGRGDGPGNVGGV